VILASDEDREGEAISWHLLKRWDLIKKIKNHIPELFFMKSQKEPLKKLSKIQGK
jgi:DNA topoisomerase IA